MSRIHTNVKANILETESDKDENWEQLDPHEIRNNLSTLSFEELINLKQKIGSKVYNNTVYGTSSKKAQSSKEIRRVNKNRPRELSSKIRQNKIKDLIKNSNMIPHQAEDNRPKDPRFDPACGEFDKDSFRKNFSFVNEIRKKEKNELEKEFRNCTDPERKETIKLLIQRIENKLRGEKSMDKIREKKKNEREGVKAQQKSKDKPIFKNKSVKKLENLVEKYEELKKTNRLQKHVQKRIKNNKIKDRKLDKQSIERN